jgi:uncharacterized protein YbcV (DUF1398 family)
MTTFDIQKLLDFLKENNYNETFSINMKHSGRIFFAHKNSLGIAVTVYYHRTGKAEVLEHDDNAICCDNTEELIDSLRTILDYQLETNQAIAAFNQNNFSTQLC